MPTTRDRGPGEVWGQSPDLHGDVDEPTKQASSDVEPRYPDYLMEFPLDIPPEIAARWKRFFDLREDILID